MGNLNTLIQLNKMTQKDKDELVKSWIIISPPFLGSMKAHQNLLGGDDEFLFIKHVFGLDFNASLEGVHNLASLWELIMKSPLAYQNEPWFKEVLKRKDYEDGKTESDLSEFSFLPSLKHECVPSNFPFNGCRIGFDWISDYVVKIQDSLYKLEDNSKLFSDWDLTGEGTGFYNIT